jgi:YidC/Oxa1 family membrane protein insertase
MLEIFYYPFLNLLTLLIAITPGHFAAVGIILLTLLVQCILLVPFKKSAQSQRRIAQLQPLLDELKREHAGDRNALAVAQMDLYKKNGINPFSSCGFALIQLPILYILYYTFLHGLTPDSPHLYNWVPKPEHINVDFFGIALNKPDSLYILPIAAAVLQLVRTLMTLPKVAKDAKDVDPQVTMMRTMAYVLPVVTVVVAGSFPAGVALYWVVSTLFSVVQQYLVNREKLPILGVNELIKKEEREHPQFTKQLEAVKAEVIGKEVKKDGTKVVVRKKK